MTYKSKNVDHSVKSHILQYNYWNTCIFRLIMFFHKMPVAPFAMTKYHGFFTIHICYIQWLEIIKDKSSDVFLMLVTSAISYLSFLMFIFLLKLQSFQYWYVLKLTCHIPLSINASWKQCTVFICEETVCTVGKKLISADGSDKMLDENSVVVYSGMVVNQHTKVKTVCGYN
jgi:hypothetical protein